MTTSLTPEKALEISRTLTDETISMCLATFAKVEAKGETTEMDTLVKNSMVQALKERYPNQ